MASRWCRRHRLLLLCLTVITIVIGISNLSKVSLESSKSLIQGALTDVASLAGLGTEKGCKQPELDIDSLVIRDLMQKDVPLAGCPLDENWVTTRVGVVKVSDKAQVAYGPINCTCIPIFRPEGDDYGVTFGKEVAIKSGARLTTDFNLITCKGKDGYSYKNIHSTIIENKHLDVTVKRPDMSTRYNVIIFGFDSVSRMSWLRNLPRSHRYFTSKLGGVLLDNYNIVGDGTPQALLPILTGNGETELPEARKRFPGAQQVDIFPWIWKDFSKAGYVTQWGEDMQSVGTFQMRMLGFKEPPVHHYMRPFHLAGLKGKVNPHCMGSVSTLRNFFDWIDDLFEVYTGIPKFTYMFHSEYSHSESYSAVRIGDLDLLQFFKSLHTSGRLNDSLLIIMSDHGARFAGIRETLEGKLEERMPYFAFRLPDSFKKRYPEAYINFHKNAHTLTTPFDIYETLKDVLDFKTHDVTYPLSRGLSLFSKIPENRTCADAKIDPHWCACVKWLPLTKSNRRLSEAARAVVEWINEAISEHVHKCHQVKLHSVEAGAVMVPNADVMKFQQSVDVDGRIPELSEKLSIDRLTYQVTVITQPGDSKFEAAVNLDLKSGRFYVQEKQISRINKYGDAPKCITDDFPHLRPYCNCKI